MDKKRYNFQNIQELLALAVSPNDEKSIMDWKPFTEGDSLGKIISDINDLSLKDAKVGKEWDEEDIELICAYIRVVKHDLNSLEEVVSDRYKHIDFIIIALEDIQNKQELLMKIKLKMAKASDARSGAYLIAQIRGSKDLPSCLYMFKGIPYRSSHPEIMESQDQFFDWLCNKMNLMQTACERSMSALEDVVSHQGISINSFTKNYISEVARRVGSVAVQEDWTIGEVIEKSPEMAKGEFNIFHLENLIQTEKHPEVIATPLRKALMTIGLEPGGRSMFNPMEQDVVTIQLGRPLKDLNRIERNQISELGLFGQDSIVLHLDDSSFWDQVNHLGDAVVTRRISEDLQNNLSGDVGISGIGGLGFIE